MRYTIIEIYYWLNILYDVALDVKLRHGQNKQQEKIPTENLRKEKRRYKKKMSKEVLPKQ